MPWERSPPILTKFWSPLRLISSPIWSKGSPESGRVKSKAFLRRKPLRWLDCNRREKLPSSTSTLSSSFSTWASRFPMQNRAQTNHLWRNLIISRFSLRWWRSWVTPQGPASLRDWRSSSKLLVWSLAIICCSLWRSKIPHPSRWYSPSSSRTVPLYRRRLV